MNKWTSTPQFEENVCQSFAVPEIRTEFVDQVYGVLMQRAAAKFPQNFYGKTNTRQQTRLVKRCAWAVVALTLLTLLVIIHQPLQTVFANLLGYGYIEDVGFFRLDTTSVLSGQVLQQHDEKILTVLHGVSDADSTRIWVSSNNSLEDVGGSWLETADGEKIPLNNWQWFPNNTQPKGYLLYFPSLSRIQKAVMLIFPAGWHLPLQFITGEQWSAQAKNNPLSVTVPYTTPTPTVNLPVLNECVSPQGFELCIRDTAYASDGLHILLESDPGTSIFTSISMDMYSGNVSFNPVNQDNQIILEAGGNRISAQATHFPPGILQQGISMQQTLTFPIDSSVSGTARLTLPAFAAKLVLPQPVMIQVDLGPNPQPGQTVPLPADIQIAGHTLHFDSAKIEGDGVSSLRLTLTSAPIEASDGWMVGMLELGRPEGIADRYGSGSINSEGRLKVFTELFGDDGRIKTGQLNLPVIDAVVIFPGPFEFNFTLPEAVVNDAQQTPTLVSGDSFNPQPTPTPLGLESYHYSGAALQPGDLLFTVTHETTTDLYAQQPQSEFTPRLIATLPGQVYQVYIHPDLQGIDYLIGKQGKLDVGQAFFLSSQLYSVRFDQSQPHLLAVFPYQYSGTVTQVLPTWSADGSLMALDLVGLQVPQGQSDRKVGWIDLSCREKGNCQIQYLDVPDPTLDLYNPQFAPQGNTLLLHGDFLSGPRSGISLIYTLNFNGKGQPGELSERTTAPNTSEENPVWLPDGNSLLFICRDLTQNDPMGDLCRRDLSTGVTTDLMKLSDEWGPTGFLISPLGDLLVDTPWKIDHLEIRIFNYITDKTDSVPFSDYYSSIVFNADQTSLFILNEDGMKITSIDLKQVTQSVVYNQSDAGFISWIGGIAVH
jgi:hypothetical protein